MINFAKLNEFSDKIIRNQMDQVTSCMLASISPLKSQVTDQNSCFSDFYDSQNSYEKVLSLLGKTRQRTNSFAVVGQIRLFDDYIWFILKKVRLF